MLFKNPCQFVRRVGDLISRFFPGAGGFILFDQGLCQFPLSAPGVGQRAGWEFQLTSA